MAGGLVGWGQGLTQGPGLGGGRPYLPDHEAEQSVRLQGRADQWQPPGSPVSGRHRRPVWEGGPLVPGTIGSWSPGDVSALVPPGMTGVTASQCLAHTPGAPVLSGASVEWPFWSCPCRLLWQVGGGMWEGPGGWGGGQGIAASRSQEHAARPLQGRQQQCMARQAGGGGHTWRCLEGWVPHSHGLGAPAAVGGVPGRTERFPALGTCHGWPPALQPLSPFGPGGLEGTTGLAPPGVFFLGGGVDEGSLGKQPTVPAPNGQSGGLEKGHTHTHTHLHIQLPDNEQFQMST